jgi:hypothetical protein
VRQHPGKTSEESPNEHEWCKHDLPLLSTHIEEHECVESGTNNACNVVQSVGIHEMKEPPIGNSPIIAELVHESNLALSNLQASSWWPMAYAGSKANALYLSADRGSPQQNTCAHQECQSNFIQHKLGNEPGEKVGVQLVLVACYLLKVLSDSV